MISIPYKDRNKQLEYMRKHQTKERKQLQSSKILAEVNRRVVQIARQCLVGRHYYSLEPLEEKGLPRVNLLVPLDAQTVLPIIHKGFQMPKSVASVAESKDVETATRTVCDEEDKLLLTGEHKGWKALGIQGLATAEGRNIVNYHGSEAATLTKAKRTLKNHGHKPPYRLVANAKYETVFGETLESQLVDYTPNLLTHEGRSDIALLVARTPRNIVLVGQDIAAHVINNVARMYEAITPVIKDANAICEIRQIP